VIHYWRRTVVMFSAWQDLQAVRAYAATSRLHLNAIRWVKNERARAWSRIFAVERVPAASKDEVWNSDGLSQLHSA
jgi:hypothetical protein